MDNEIYMTSTHNSMTLDKAIHHAAEQARLLRESLIISSREKHKEELEKCKKYTDEYIQLAQWLTQLKSIYILAEDLKDDEQVSARVIRTLLGIV